MTDRELDVLVAVHVLDLPRWLIHTDDTGPHVMTDPATGRESSLVRSVSHYSADTSEIVGLIDAMRIKGWCVSIQPKRAPADERGDGEISFVDWTVGVSRPRQHCGPGQPMYRRHDGENVARLVCVASLIALGVEVSS